MEVKGDAARPRGASGEDAERALRGRREEGQRVGTGEGSRQSTRETALSRRAIAPDIGRLAKLR